MIETRERLLALVERIRGAGEIALDCEFHGEGRYYTKLCLVQIAGGDEIAAIDPLAVDLAPLGELLADPSIVKLFHSGQNDIPLLARATGETIRNVFDTQVAAPFVGFRSTPPYPLLIERLCGVRLSKRERFTDWSARPLSDEQIEYALDDVRYLPQVATALRRSLERLGRLEWVAMATEEMVAKALAPRDRSRLYLKLRLPRDLSRRKLAIVREAAAWRDRRAAEVDIPPHRVMNDDVVVQMAYKPPRTPEDVSRMRGTQSLGRAVGGLLEAIRHAMELPESELPPPIEIEERNERGELLALLLSTALRVLANELEIAHQVIATRDQMDELVAWHAGGRSGEVPELVAPEGWKGAAVGDVLLAVLDGKMVLRADPSAPTGVALAPAEA